MQQVNAVIQQHRDPVEGGDHAGVLAVNVIRVNRINIAIVARVATVIEHGDAHHRHACYFGIIH